MADCQASGRLRTAVTSNRGDVALVKLKRSAVERELKRLHGRRWLVGHRVVDPGEPYDSEGVPIDELWSNGIAANG